VYQALLAWSTNSFYKKEFSFGALQDDSGGLGCFCAFQGPLGEIVPIGHHKWESALILYTDASTRAIGGVLMQIQDGIEKPVIFDSHVLSN